MATRTIFLDDFELDVDIEKCTARDLRKMIAKEIGMPQVGELMRLEGFQEPWELMCVCLCFVQSFDFVFVPSVRGPSVRAVVFSLFVFHTEGAFFLLRAVRDEILSSKLTKNEYSQYRGKELEADKTLKECGVPEKDDSEHSGENGLPRIVIVRKHLVAEGWKMINHDQEDSDTEEDDF
jgi:hypothetical protein